MDSRERVFTSLSHSEPDRPPISATFTPEAAKLLRADLGKYEDDLGFLMGNDLIKTTVGIENSYHYSDDPTYTCPFGVEWRNVSNYTGAYTEIIGGALTQDTDGEKLKAYTIPDPNNPALYAHVEKAVQTYGKQKYIIGSCQCSLFETAWYLHGLEDTLCDLLADEDYMIALFDKIVQFPLNAGLHMIEAGVDMVWLGDDIATQLNAMMSLDVWRKLIKPRYAMMFAAFKKKNPNIAIAYHSCGNCEVFIEDFIEIGLDVLNPIQPLAMSPYKIKQKYGNRLSLFGAVDVQNLMPFGTKEEIIQTVREYKKYLGAQGGYILSPAHHIQSDTSLENIKAFYQTAMEPTTYDNQYV